LPTNLQNFTQKDLTEVKIFLKVLERSYFFETPCRRVRVAVVERAVLLGGVTNDYHCCFGIVHAG